MKRFFKLICSVFGVSLFDYKGTDKNGFIQISPEALSKKLQSEAIQLVDVRTPNEYHKESIKTSININFLSLTFSNDLCALNKEKDVYIYCRSGKRSRKSVKDFQKAGFKKIYNLEGGILNWTAKGLETIK